MNLPNKLTVSRVILTPLFMAVMLIEPISFNYTAALLLFIIASLTDMLDGKIARGRGIVTNFGKFLDPVADKMLTTAAFLGFMIIMPTANLRIQLTVITFITLFREFTVSSVRLVVVSSEIKKVIPANIWGKLKTVTQMISIILGLAAYSLKEIGLLSDTVFNCAVTVFAVIAWTSAVLCTVSGVIYLYESKEFIDSSK